MDSTYFEIVTTVAWILFGAGQVAAAGFLIARERRYYTWMALFGSVLTLVFVLIILLGLPFGLFDRSGEPHKWIERVSLMAVISLLVQTAGFLLFAQVFYRRGGFSKHN